MKKLYETVVTVLVFIGTVTFFYNVYLKIIEGKAFERYRTVWLYELDYFSVAFMLISSLILIIFIYIYFHIRDKIEFKKAQKDLTKQRKK